MIIKFKDGKEIEYRMRPRFNISNSSKLKSSALVSGKIFDEILDKILKKYLLKDADLQEESK